MVRRGLQALHVDERLSRHAQTNVGSASQPRVSNALAQAVDWLTLLLLLPAVLGALQLQGILGPVQGMVDKILNMLPNVLTAALVIGIAYFVGRIVEGLATSLLSAVGVDRLAERVGLVRPNMSPSWLPSRVIGLALRGGERVEGDAFVLALPPWQLLPVLPNALRATTYFRQIADLPIAPAISVQLWMDKVIDDKRFVLVGGSPAAVWQDLSHTHFPDDEHSRISVIVSPADALLDDDDDEIVRMVLTDLQRADPRFDGAAVAKSVVLKHRHHLVRPLPGAMSSRPGAVTPVPNLFLAGDFLEQPFFGSQEGAVRGGHMAADAVLRAVRLGFEEEEARP